MPLSEDQWALLREMISRRFTAVSAHVAAQAAAAATAAGAGGAAAGGSADAAAQAAAQAVGSGELPRDPAAAVPGEDAAAIDEEYESLSANLGLPVGSVRSHVGSAVKARAQREASAVAMCCAALSRRCIE